MNIPVSIIFALATTDSFDKPAPIMQATTNKKQIIKRPKNKKSPAPGKGRPAKGYNPETKTWSR